MLVKLKLCWVKVFLYILILYWVDCLIFIGKVKFCDRVFL